MEKTIAFKKILEQCLAEAVAKAEETAPRSPVKITLEFDDETPTEVLENVENFVLLAETPDHFSERTWCNREFMNWAAVTLMHLAGVRGRQGAHEAPRG